MTRIIRRPAFERDIDHSARYIARDNPEAAFRFLEAAETTLGDLAAHPQLGAVRI